MSIECTFITKTQSHTLDLEDYLGDFGSFVDALYQEFELDAPVDINTFFKIEDTDYFNSMDDVEVFLQITFPYGYLPKMVLAWVYHTNNQFQNFKAFNEKYMGKFEYPADFCKEYIARETEIQTMPTCVVKCIDYEMMWDQYLSDHFYALKVEDDSIDSVTMYIYAIFKN